jgi:hypothetical protein
MISCSPEMENGRTPYTLAPSLADILQLLFGPDWRRCACVGFGRSRRQIARWSSGARMPNWAIREIERRTLAAAANHEQWIREQIKRAEEQARERAAAIGQALTWVKLLRVLDNREPTSRVGRPRKRPSVVKARESAIPNRQSEWLTEG